MIDGIFLSLIIIFFAFSFALIWFFDRIGRK